MDRLIAAGGLRDWAPRAFSEFAQTRPLHAIGTRGFPWIEIDFPEDYQRARPRGPAASIERRRRTDATTTADAARRAPIAAGDLR